MPWEAASLQRQGIPALLLLRERALARQSSLHLSIATGSQDPRGACGLGEELPEESARWPYSRGGVVATAGWLRGSGRLTICLAGKSISGLPSRSLDDSASAMRSRRAGFRGEHLAAMLPRDGRPPSLCESAPGRLLAVGGPGRHVRGCAREGASACILHEGEALEDADSIAVRGGKALGLVVSDVVAQRTCACAHSLVLPSRARELWPWHASRRTLALSSMVGVDLALVCASPGAWPLRTAPHTRM